jgi:hypothetical protein
LPWAVVATIAEGFLLVALLQSSTRSDIVGGLLGALPVLLMGAWMWYKVVFAPRLTLNAEGFTLRTRGLDPEEVSIPWAEIQSLRLVSEDDRAGRDLTLVVVTRSDGPYARPQHGRRPDLELALGKASLNTVDGALRRYCPSGYTRTSR